MRISFRFDLQVILENDEEASIIVERFFHQKAQILPFHALSLKEYRYSFSSMPI